MNYISTLIQLYHLRENTKKSHDSIKSLQEKKLRKLLRYAYDHSEYYREEFEKFQINANNIDEIPLNDFPTIDKKTLLSNFDRIVTTKDVKQEDLIAFDNEQKDKKLFLDKYHIVHSSGSTGKPGYFLYDEKAWNTMLYGIIRGALWGMSIPKIIKFLVGGPRIVYIAATDGRYGGAMAVGDGIEGMKASQIFLDIKTPLDEWINKIQEFKPNMIIGYPSAIKILGELIEKGDVNLKINRVITCGEPLGLNLRQYLEKIFATEVINIYGASESLALGIETDKSDGMYLFDDLNYIEIAQDCIYLTSLYNYAQPLIRYRLTDKLHHAPKDNIYPFSKVKSIMGRDEDIMWFEADGSREFIHPLAIEGFCIEGMRDYQFIQTSKQSFELRIETTTEADKQAIEYEMRLNMQKIFFEKNLHYVKFTVKFVDMILPNMKTGKKKLVEQSGILD